MEFLFIVEAINISLHNHIPIFVWEFTEDRYNSEGQDNVICHPIPHQLELPIRWNKGNRPISIKLAQPDTSVKGTIINLHARLPRIPALLVNNQLIIQSEFTLRHARQLGIHLNLPRHLIPQDISTTGQQQIKTLQNINVHLILLMPYPLPPPINRSRNLTSQLRRIRFIQRSYIPQIDIQPQHVHGTILRIAKVHRLVHEFVDECHVVTHGVFVKFFAEVGFEDADLLEEVFEDEGGVDVGAGEGYEVHVEVTGVEKGAVLDAFYGGLGARFFGGDYLFYRGWGLI